MSRQLIYESFSSKSYFYLMSDPSYRWQDIYLSLRASVLRIPDVFNTFVNIFCFLIRQTSLCICVYIGHKDERILIVNPLDGKNYEINRYCPHNGADLKDARIDKDGNLVCPRHSWLFKLNNNGICEKVDSQLMQGRSSRLYPLRKRICTFIKSRYNGSTIKKAKATFVSCYKNELKKLIHVVK